MGYCDLTAFRSGPPTSTGNSTQSRAAAPTVKGLWCEGPVGFGHALLRVTHEDTFDDQPMADRAAGLAAVADLRLDNRSELAAALGIDAQTLHTLADSALVLRAYKKWGENCAEHLLGDFAFAVWDERARKLVLARDHMGARYIYYYKGPDFFVFANDLKGLWAIADVPHRLDEFHIGWALTLDLAQQSGTTPFAGINGLLPATVMTISVDGTTEGRRYWQPQADPVHLNRDEAYYVAAYRRVLAEAVQCRLRRNVKPTGLMLSGGFDSAAIAALAGPGMQAQGRKLLAAASVLPPGHNEKFANARKWVEACERHMPHLDVHYVTREGFGLLDSVEDWFVRTETRASPNRVANTALFTDLANRGACVVMDGYGGDYTLHPRTRGWLMEQLLAGKLRLFLSELRAYRRNRDMPFWPMLKQEVIKPLLPRAIWRLWMRWHDARPRDQPVVPLAPAFADELRAKGVSLNLKMPRSGRPGYYGRILGIFIHEQTKSHNSMHVASSPYGLEYVQPFHDKRVVELGLALPSSLMVRNGRQRYLARTALADLYPPELLTRGDENDNRTPDMLEIAERARPQLLAGIGRMEKSARLQQFFDFKKMRNVLNSTCDVPYGESRTALVRHSIRAFFVARFIEWVERDNRSETDTTESEAQSR